MLDDGFRLELPEVHLTGALESFGLIGRIFGKEIGRAPSENGAWCRDSGMVYRLRG